ncbi:MAG: nucleotidyl transferase AbiEii/AbiGii toxin family protein [Agriterribacter sp.]
MNFHQSSAFKDAIEATAEKLSLRPVLIEKDYWVTFVLKNLSTSEYVHRVVFKGGTSLSKAYKCISRFSEDVDLAIIPGEPLSQSQGKALLRNIDHTVGTGLTYVNGQKLGRNRTSIYDYPKTIEEKNFGVVKDKIIVEINTFTNPIPHSSLPISSYIYDFLLGIGNTELIKLHALDPFHVNVLSLERTFFEKLLSLNRLSYLGIDRLKEKIRHFYDLHELYYNTPLKDAILADTSFDTLTLVRIDDESIPTFIGDWLGKPFSSSPLLSSLDETWKALIPTYQKELGDLVWTPLPAPDSILTVMNMIKEFVERYDKIHFV